MNAENPDALPPNAQTGSRLAIMAFPMGEQYQTNCYVVSVEGHDACWIIDAGYGPGELIEAVRARSLKPEAILLTHAHLDHIAGVREVLEAFPDTPIRIHPAETKWLADPVLNLSASAGAPVTAPAPSGTLEEGQTLTLAGSEWAVFHTPGHSPGSVTLHCAGAGIAFVGDALFAGSIGRHDFPGSSFDTLAASIREKLYTLPETTVVLPGHGPQTTIGRERVSNPFVRAE